MFKSHFVPSPTYEVYTGENVCSDVGVNFAKSDHSGKYFGPSVDLTYTQKKFI